MLHFDGDGATNFTFSTSPAGLNGALISSHLHTLSTTRLCACVCVRACVGGGGCLSVYFILSFLHKPFIVNCTFDVCPLLELHFAVESMAKTVIAFN